MPPKQPNQFEELFIELDGTFKRGGFPVDDFIIRDKLNVSGREVHMLRGQKGRVTEIVSGASNTHSTSLDEYFIAIKDVTISRGIRLPEASLGGVGKIYVIKDMSGSAAATTITIAPLDGETLDGEPTQSITANWGIKRVLSDGSNWFTW
jgi:hypothetical protein